MIYRMLITGTLLLMDRALSQPRNIAYLVADLQQYLSSNCIFIPYERRPHTPVYEERLALETKKLLPNYASLYYQSTDIMLENQKFESCHNTSPLHVLVLRSSRDIAIMEKLLTSYFWKSSVWLLLVIGGGTLESLLKPMCGLETFLVLVADLTVPGAELSAVFCSYDQVQREHLGLWKGATGLQVSADLRGAAFNPLKGSHLRVAVLEIPRITEMYANKTRVRGIFGNVWEAIGRELNFTNEYVMVADHAYGEEQEDGSWNGVVGMVKRMEVDVGLAPLTMTSTRVGVVDFTIPLLSSNYIIFIQKPKTTQINWKSFLKPFTWELWLTITVLVVVIGLINTVAHVTIRRHVGSSGEEYCSTTDNFFYAFTILYCYQGLDKLPSSVSCRIVCILTFLTAVILSEAYSGKLISFITVKKTSLPFTSLEGLYKDGTFKFGVVADTAEDTLFKESNQDLLRKVYQKLMAPDPTNFVPNEIRGLQRACDMNYAFLSSYEETISFVPDVNCSIVTIPEVFFKSALAIALPKNSPYINFLNTKISSLLSTGVISRLYRKAWPREEGLPSTDTTPVEFSNIIPVLNILVAGIALSLLLLLVEILVKPCHVHCTNDMVLTYNLRDVSSTSTVLSPSCQTISFYRRHSF